MNTIVTTEDISMFQNMFSKLSTIIVQASEVGQRLPALEAQITQLTNDCEAVRKRNMELDEELFNVRKQRDDAQSQVQHYEAERSSMVNDIDEAHATISRCDSRINDLTLDLTNARKDRDDHAYKSLELQDQLDKANALLSQFRSLLGQPDPKPVTLSVAEPVSHDPVPTTQGVTKLYPGDSGYDWAKAEKYDHERQQWYMEVNTSAAA